MMQILRPLFTVFIFLVLATAFGFLSSTYSGQLYESLTRSSLGGSFLDFTDVVGFLLSFLFLVSLFSGLRKKSERIVLGAVAVIVFAFFVIIDSAHLYFHIGVVLIAFALGWGIEKLFQNFRKKA